MEQAKQQFAKYIRGKGLKNTSQRELIVNTFLATEGHISVEELYLKLKRKDPKLGYATVYRTLKLMSQCGVANELKFGDGVRRFEHKYGHNHHDHLVCLKCGKIIEIQSAKIEKLQEQLAKKNLFSPQSHKLEIYGRCKNCR